MKSEPTAYSIDDLKSDKRTTWDGVRNYQARNFMRDDMKIGDRVLFYHSNTKIPAVVGEGKVCSKPYPDETQFSSRDSHYDPKAKKDNPTWILVDICFVQKFKNPVSLYIIKANSKFKDMLLVQKGMRLSVQPISKEHFSGIVTMGKI